MVRVLQRETWHVHTKDVEDGPEQWRKVSCQRVWSGMSEGSVVHKGQGYMEGRMHWMELHRGDWACRRDQVGVEQAR